MVEAEEVPEQDPRLGAEIADNHAGGALFVLGKLEGGGIGPGIDAGAAAAPVKPLDAGEDAGVTAADVHDEILDVHPVGAKPLGGGAAVKIIQRLVGPGGGLDMHGVLELDLDVGVGRQPDLGELVHEPVPAGGEGGIDGGDEEGRIAPLDALGGIGEVEQLLSEGLVLGTLRRKDAEAEGVEADVIGTVLVNVLLDVGPLDEEVQPLLLPGGVHGGGVESVVQPDVPVLGPPIGDLGVRELDGDLLVALAGKVGERPLLDLAVEPLPALERLGVAAQRIGARGGVADDEDAEVAAALAQVDAGLDEGLTAGLSFIDDEQDPGPVGADDAADGLLQGALHDGDAPDAIVLARAGRALAGVKDLAGIAGVEPGGEVADVVALGEDGIEALDLAPDAAVEAVGGGGAADDRGFMRGGEPVGDADAGGVGGLCAGAGSPPGGELVLHDGPGAVIGPSVLAKRGVGEEKVGGVGKVGARAEPALLGREVFGQCPQLPGELGLVKQTLLSVCRIGWR